MTWSVRETTIRGSDYVNIIGHSKVVDFAFHGQLTFFWAIGDIQLSKSQLDNRWSFITQIQPCNLRKFSFSEEPLTVWYFMVFPISWINSTYEIMN